MKYPKSLFPDIYKHTSNNEIDILHSKKCSCLFCRQSYDARKVNDWINDEGGVTAICPECGMAAVVGDASGYALDRETIKSINLHFYGESYMQKHPEAAQKFIARYEQKKISHKKENEALYISYLSLLASLSSPDAAYSLGEVYEFGTEFTPKDPHAAFSWYANKSLSNDGEALTRLGVLAESGQLGKLEPELAYQCYAKAMALGSYAGLMHFVDCYSNGVYVNKDIGYAYKVLGDIFPECHARFSFSLGKDVSVFPSLCYRLGKVFELGNGTEIDTYSALRFYLFAQFGYQLLSASNLLKGDMLSESNETDLRINALAKEKGLLRGDPQFDSDTFANSLVSYGQIYEQYDFLAPINLKSFSYDGENCILDFETVSSTPQLIVDVGNLFCGFVPGTIAWRFYDVVEASGLGGNHQFNRVIGNGDAGFSFVNSLAAPKEENVAEIKFGNPVKEKEPRKKSKSSTLKKA